MTILNDEYQSMTDKPSRADVLRITGEPVAFIWETAAETGVQLARPHPNLGVAVVPLYTEAQLLAILENER